MEIETLYSSIAKNRSKQLNLKLRGFLYEIFYLPELEKWNAFSDYEKWCEAGVGYGDKFKKTKQKCPLLHLTGIDNCQEMLGIAAQKNPKFKELYRLDDARTLKSIEDSSLDGIMFYQILHHFGLSELEKIFSTAGKKLKPGGKIVVIDSFNLENPVRKVIFSTIEFLYATLSFRSKENEQYKNCPRDIFVKFVEENGFKLTHEINPRSWKDKVKFFVSEPLVFQKK